MGESRSRKERIKQWGTQEREMKEKKEGRLRPCVLPPFALSLSLPACLLRSGGGVSGGNVPGVSE